MYRICGKKRLSGSIRVQGSKNAALPMLAASLLCKGCVVLHNCPKILDVYAMLSILKHLGCYVKWEDNTVVICTDGLFSCKVPKKYAGAMRSSVMLLGPLLGRVGCADLAWPGGCMIGARPVDIHQMALKQMGVRFESSKNCIFAACRGLYGAVVRLPFPSVGATENVIMAAVLAEGTTVLKNAAREPEIITLCKFLRAMGARISGEGTETIYIEGVKSLKEAEYAIPSDRIVMGTYLMAVLGTGGEVFLEGDCAGCLAAPLLLARKTGARIQERKQGLKVFMEEPSHVPIQAVTAPYPGFPTDLQSPLLALMAVSGHICTIKETIFESRFATAGELKKMGADIRIEGQKACVYGKQTLEGADVSASDLRGGAALILAGLFAEGVTTVHNASHIRRGYEHIETDLRMLGADIDAVGSH